MHPQISSWLRDTGKLTVRYVLVGFAFVPAGLVYAELQRAGRGTQWAMFACLLLGLPFPAFVWKWSSGWIADAKIVKPLTMRHLSSALEQAMLANPQNWALADASLAVMGEHTRQLVDMRDNKSVSRQQPQLLRVRPASNQGDATFASERMGVTHAAFSGASS